MATEEISVEILKNTLRLLDYINAYSPTYPATKESTTLLTAFEENRELLKRKIIQVIRIFGSPGSIFYIPEEYKKQIIKSIHERIQLFENT
jgi:hypothetical protein